VTNILLKDWDLASRYWVLDTASGTTQRSDRGVCHGFLSLFHGHDGDTTVPRVAAVYVDGGRLWFQVDDRRWAVEDVHFEYKLDSSGASQFTLLSQDEAAVELIYLGPAANPLNKRDPSFDALDMELQDIFYFTTRNSRNPNWREGILALWDTGFADD
jgi:hypothetical protein